MNSQNQKHLAIAAVVALHVGVITLMLAQHGCKSGAQKAPAPVAASPTPAPAPVAAAPVVATDSENGFTAPTAPARETVIAATPMPLAQLSEPLGSMSSTPAPAPAAAPMTVTWKVSKGDTLSSIAKKNGVTVDELIAANAPKVSRTSPLSLNQVLNVPTHAAAASAPAAADSGTRTYKVVTGDTLSKVASKNGTTVKTLKELNGLTSDNIREGEILKLPASAGGATPSVSAAAAPVADASGATYQVKSGDTLGKIATKVGVKTADLMAVNGFTDTTAKNIKPGQILKLPANAHAPDAAAATPAALTPSMVTPTTILSPSSTPVSVTAVPVTATGTPPPVTPINP